MFEIESKNPDVITIVTKKTTVNFDVAQFEIDANLEVGKIEGPGEFEIGDLTIRGIAVDATKKEKGGESASGADGVVVKGDRTIYDVEIGGVHIGILGGIEEGLDELGMIDVLCTTSVRAVRELSPKIVVAMGNVDGMVTELKLSARTEKKLKIKKADDFPATMEVVVLQ